MLCIPMISNLKIKKRSHQTSTKSNLATTFPLPILPLFYNMIYQKIYCICTTSTKISGFPLHLTIPIIRIKMGKNPIQKIILFKPSFIQIPINWAFADVAFFFLQWRFPPVPLFLYFETYKIFLRITKKNRKKEVYLELP